MLDSAAKTGLGQASSTIPQPIHVERIMSNGSKPRAGALPESGCAAPSRDRYSRINGTASRIIDGPGPEECVPISALLFAFWETLPCFLTVGELGMTQC